MTYYGMPGPLEMLIILAILAMLGLPILILFVGLSSERKRAARPPGPVCPKCGGWVVPKGNYCQWCGKALGTVPDGNPFT